MSDAARIRERSFEAGPELNARSAEIQSWIDTVVDVLSRMAPEQVGSFEYDKDSGPVSMPGDTPTWKMNEAMANRQRSRLDRHVERLAAIRDET